MLRYFLACSIMLYCCGIYACDICGCYMGITPYKNYTSIGIFYRYRAFHGYAQKPSKNLFPATMFRVAHDGHSHPDSTNLSPADNERLGQDYELYRIYEVRVRYYLHKRIELNGIIPWYFNSSKINGIHEQAPGLGDISVFAGYHLVDQLDRSAEFRQRLVAGGGVKWQTGEYYLKGHHGERLDALLQPGTGSNDLLLYINYLFGFNKIGATTNSLYKINGTNYFGERIGNSITTFASVFYMIGKNKWKVVPSVQLYHEYTSGLRISNTIRPGTAMHEFMIGTGMDLFLGKFLINAALQLPVYQAGQQGLSSVGRMVFGVSYNLVQKQHLLK